MHANTLHSLPLPEIAVEELLDGQIYAVAVASSTRQTIDDFADIVSKHQENLLPGTKVFYLFDFSQSFAGFNTPYGRQRMDEMAKLSTHLVSYAAIVAPNTFLLQISRILLDKFQRKGATNRLFIKRDEALKWLQQEIAKG